ncbi:hypothetical protein ACVW0P_002593 [Mucilaginibacter sp. UYNi724]
MGKIIFEYNDADDQYALESAWAVKTSDGYKLDNILFYTLGYALGDVVSVDERNGELYVTGLIEESGHSTIRILFNNRDDVQSTRNKLKEMGCDSELSNISILISVDVPSEIDYKIIKQYLYQGELNGVWNYEESCLAHDA